MNKKIIKTEISAKSAGTQKKCLTKKIIPHFKETIILPLLNRALMLQWQKRTKSDRARPLKQPITEPPDDIQYRAIGLVKGKFVPGKDKWEKGKLVTADGTEFDLYILAKLRRLAKKIGDAETVWVLYPKTKMPAPGTPATADKAKTRLIFLANGIWCPTLKKEPNRPVEINIFHISGEVVYVSKDRAKPWCVVKIMQTPTKEGESPTFFNVRLLGALSDNQDFKGFWRIKAVLVGDSLRIKDSEKVAVFEETNTKKSRAK